MDEEKLRRIIEEGEGVEIEFKQSTHNAQDMARIICAFANTQGGILILGVSDDGKIEGIKESPDRVQHNISSANSMIHSSPLISVEVHVIEEKKVVVVIVHGSVSSVFHSVGGIIYVRLGSTVQRLEGQSIVEFLRNRQILLFDESFDYSARIGDIDSKKIAEYLEARKEQDYLKAHKPEDFLMSKKLASLMPNLKIKNAAILFFAKDMQSFFPYARIKLVRFDGTQPVKVLAYEEASGCLPEMIDHAVNFARRYISKEFVIKETRREEIPMLPEQAFREIIINAVAHRDYFNKNEIQLSIFDDRLELTNPGGLPEGMNRELLGSLSIQRNPTIYQLLKDYGYMEGIGSGISKIFRTMKESNLDEPEFMLSKEFFRVILRMGKVAIGPAYARMNERQKKAVEHMKRSKKIKSEEYAAMNNVSLTTAVSDLNLLEKMGIVKKIGKYRSVYYTLNE